jgi:hypothetical protein
MGNLKNVLSWAGIILLGLVSGVLEDVLFVVLLVPYLPTSWDVTGDLFWVFTVPLAQLLTLAVTGTLAWFLGLRQPARLITFWACWSLARAAFLTRINNPVEDVLVYLLWIAVWCALIALFARVVGTGGSATSSPRG